MRSILLGCLASGCLIGGCFEDPLPPPATSDESTDGPMSTGTSQGPTATSTTTATATGTAGPTTNMSMTTTDPGTSTMGSVTIADSDSSGDPPDPCVRTCAGLACGDVDECDCGECNPMATCSDDQSYCGLPIGFYNVFADQDQVNSQIQLGFRFQVFEPRTVRRLGVIAGGAGAEIAMALYGDDGFGPSNRIVNTAAVMLYAKGNNEFDVGATDIMPGDYWVFLHTNGPAPLRRTPNGDNNYELALRSPAPFGAGFPVNMDDESIIMDYRYNLYMVVED